MGLTGLDLRSIWVMVGDMTKTHDTEDPTRSSAADALAHKAEYGARHAYAIGYEDGRRAAKADTDDAESYFKRAMDKYAAEKARADAAEQRVAELRVSLAAIAAPEVDGATTPATLWMERKALTALASTVEVAERWCPVAERDGAIGALRHTQTQLDEAVRQRDDAIAARDEAVAELAALRAARNPQPAIDTLAANLNRVNELRHAAIAARDEAVAGLKALDAMLLSAWRARDELGIQLVAAQAGDQHVKGGE